MHDAIQKLWVSSDNTFFRVWKFSLHSKQGFVVLEKRNQNEEEIIGYQKLDLRIYNNRSFQHLENRS